MADDRWDAAHRTRALAQLIRRVGRNPVPQSSHAARSPASASGVADLDDHRKRHRGRGPRRLAGPPRVPRAGAEARGATHSGFHIALAGPRFRYRLAVRASRGSDNVPESMPANRSVSAGCDPREHAAHAASSSSVRKESRRRRDHVSMDPGQSDGRLIPGTFL